MAYLYDQTGHSLGDAVLDPDQPEPDEPEDDEDVDEGFQDVDDLTVPGLEVALPAYTLRPRSTAEKPPVQQSPTRALPGSARTRPSPQKSPEKEPQPSTSGTPAKRRLDFIGQIDVEVPDPDPQVNTDTDPQPADPNMEAVGPDGVAGYDRVKALARYLVEIREQEALSTANVNVITHLWNRLPECDKGKVPYQPRYTKKPRGRYKATKGEGAAPGVVSVRRSLLGEGSPAADPAASRLTDAICVLLCKAYQSPSKGPRFKEVLDAYACIRDLVASNLSLMQSTDIQLFQLNERTLRQWHNSRVKSQEQDILQQGLKLPAPPQAATEPLPAPRTLLPRPPQYQQPEHTYIWPADTTGQVQPGRKRPREPRPVVPGPAASSVPLPGGDQPSVPEVQETVEIQSTVTVSYSTEYKRKRREAEGKTKNQRHKAFNECRKCGLPKTNDTGHVFLGGFVYCRNEASPEQSEEEWRATVTAKMLARKAQRKAAKEAK